MSHQIRKGPSRKALWAAALSVLAAGAVLLGIWLASSSRSLGASPPSAELLQRAEGLDGISISAVFQPESRSLQVTQRFSLVNRDSAPRDMAVFRAYANAYQTEDTSPIATEELHDACYPKGFSPGALSVSSAMAGPDGEALTAIQHLYLDEAKTVLRLSLPFAWEPGKTLIASFQYTLYIPEAASRFGFMNDLWALGNAFLIPAVFEEGVYRMDAYYAVGDPFLSDCVNYTVAVDVPEGYACAGSAWPSVTQTGQGLTRYSFQAYAVRDFALCLSRGYQAAQVMESGVLLTVYAQDKKAARDALEDARKALRCFSERYGAYPYPSLTFAEVDFPFGGMEYPGLVMLAAAQLQKGGEDLEWVIAHETAHQWWYAVVGSDPVFQAWQDEALCEFSVLDYAETYYGKQARETLEFSRVETAMRITIPRGVTPGSPLSYFGSMSEYSLVVYGRGAAMLCALNEAMGGGLDEFLRKYYDDYQFVRASREDFESSLRAFSGEDWTPLIIDYLDTYLIH